LAEFHGIEISTGISMGTLVQKVSS